ncbi:YggS family pyridoxal phosphate enzyme [Clostridia bacterium]|nr:YggS family pyridoxal phosphate enzyme [Clostridia bacterium]
MDREDILSRVAEIRRELAACARDPQHPPTLLPVTKTQPAQRILALREAGITAIGENRAQEITEKYPALSGDFSFHLIGRLQTNKIKYIIGSVCMVQSVDRLDLAEALHARAAREGLTLPVLAQVNIGGESRKAGVTPHEAEAFVRALARLSSLRVRGLMTVMPEADDPETIRPLFRAMRALYELLRAQAIDGVTMDTLSMGMSGDWRVAAQEGATMVRIGAAIFGPREG